MPDAETSSAEGAGRGASGGFGFDPRRLKYVSRQTNTTPEKIRTPLATKLILRPLATEPGTEPLRLPNIRIHPKQDLEVSGLVVSAIQERGKAQAKCTPAPKVLSSFSSDCQRSDIMKSAQKIAIGTVCGHRTSSKMTKHVPVHLFWGK
jgi:hypothetical protein